MNNINIDNIVNNIASMSPFNEPLAYALLTVLSENNPKLKEDVELYHKFLIKAKLENRIEFLNEQTTYL